MASISSAGIGSGLDVNSIVTQIMAVEQQPLKRLQSAASSLDTRISAFGAIKSTLSTLSDAATRLATVSSWSAKTATSSDSASVAAAIGDAASASPTAFTVEVQQLARSQSVASAALPLGTAVGTGRLTLEFGRWDAGSFAADGASTPLGIDIVAGEDSVGAIAAKINAAQSGVVATVLTDATGQRLLLRAKGTGEASGFRVVAQDDDGNSQDDAGLSRLAFDPASGAFGMAAPAQAAGLQYAQNAKATINGIAVQSESNVLSDTVPGLKLTLAKVTTAPVEVSVGIDNTALTEMVKDFVSAYNAANSLLGQSTRYDAETRTAGLLQGDSTANALNNALRRLLGTRSEGGPLASLSDIGVAFAPARDGSLAIDSGKLAAAARNPADLAALFTADNGNPATDGFALKLKRLLDGMAGAGGIVDAKTESLNAQKKANAQSQERVSDRLAATETRLRKQYSTLDAQMAQFTALGTYINQQVAQWNKSTS